MAGIDIGLDVFTLLLPVSVVAKLNMSWRKRISLIALFGLGLL